MENGNANATLIKYNSSGSLQWERHWGGVNTDYGKGGCTDLANNIYLVGSTRSLGDDLINGDCFIVKFDENGSILWNRTWGTASGDSASDVVVDSDFNVHISAYFFRKNSI